MSSLAPEMKKDALPRSGIRVAFLLVIVAASWFLPNLLIEYLTMTDRVMILLRGLIFGIFLVLGWRDIVRLFSRPAKNMGMGLTRIWAVARTTLLEAWAGRVWILPLLWLIASIVLINVIRPFDETERMPLNIRTLLDMQTVLLMVMMWVMACVSLPRERERKIIMTNASKPLSRLEIVLGKMTGFWVVAGLLLLVMGLASWAILGWENHRIKQTAAEAFALQEADFARRSGAGGTDVAGVNGGAESPPSESTRRLRDEGSLFAWNFISVPKDGMSIMGYLDLGQNPPIRYLRGSSNEKVTYHFEQLEVSEESLFGAVGNRPFFVFVYPIKLFGDRPPAKVQIHVSAVRSDPHARPPPKPQEKTLTLNEQGAIAWEPDNPGELFSYTTGGVLVANGPIDVEVSCTTPGAYLEIAEGAEPDANGVVPNDANFNVQFFTDRNSSQPRLPHAKPPMRGFERRDRQEIAGPKDTDPTMTVGLRREPLLETAIFRFSGSTLKGVPVDKDGTFPLSLLLQEYKQDFADKPTVAKVLVMSQDAMGEQPFTANVEVIEKRLMPLRVPSLYLGKGGDMLVILQCLTRGHSISLLEDSVRIELPATPFVLNLFKSELVIFLEAAVLIAICVTCSVRLGWPVAMLLAAQCFIFGWLVEFLAGLQEYGGLGSLNYHANGKPSATFQFFDKVTMSAWNSLAVLASFLPNFTIYNPSDYISNLQNMPWSAVGWNAFYSVLFVAPFIAVAYLLFRKQEVG